VFIDDDGTVTIIPCEVEGDEVSFITDHFSHYGIIGTKVNISVTDRRTDTLEIITFIALASIGVTAITIIFVKKRKKDSNNK
jgi:predicted membrane channel-forming protein YqfA (hemolysin III family)